MCYVSKSCGSPTIHITSWYKNNSFGSSSLVFYLQFSDMSSYTIVFEIVKNKHLVCFISFIFPSELEGGFIYWKDAKTEIICNDYSDF